MRLCEFDTNLQEVDLRALGNAFRNISKMDPNIELQNTAKWLMHKKLPQVVRDKKDQERIRQIEKRQKEKQDDNIEANQSRRRTR